MFQSDPAETTDIIAKIFEQWNRKHPEGTVRDFWRAVAVGDVWIPSN